MSVQVKDDGTTKYRQASSLRDEQTQDSGARITSSVAQAVGNLANKVQNRRKYNESMVSQQSPSNGVGHEDRQKLKNLFESSQFA